ncbi:N66 matrix protein [Bicyclus anynana]|uniref:N66 matrix protein n=1 Tax=Bicyclus anynana TaxID=110368 RepID=A0A6J1P3U6_BICAN|nr:N66 matrix protein [Bicyclus anynana]
MKAYLCTLIYVALYTIITNAKPQRCRAGNMGMTYCGKSWAEYFGNLGGGNPDYGNYYGGGNMQPSSGSINQNNSSLGPSGERPPHQYCVGCTINYVGTGTNNTNQVHIQANDNPFARWRQWRPQRFPGGFGGMNGRGRGMNNGGGGGNNNGGNEGNNNEDGGNNNGGGGNNNGGGSNNNGGGGSNNNGGQGFMHNGGGWNNYDYYN